jgi:hypothetical protein
MRGGEGGDPANVARLLDTPGFKVIDCKTEGDLLWVELRGHKRRRPVCSGCGQPAPPSAIHDRKLRTVRDLACFGRRTYATGAQPKGG